MAFCSNSGFGRLVDTDVIYTGPSITCGGSTVNPGDTVREFISVVFLCANDIVVEVQGNTLPIPDGTGSKVAFVGSGTYTQSGGPDIVVPSGNMGILSWDGNEWSLSQSVDMPEQTADGVIENGNNKATSGDTVYRAIAPLTALIEGGSYTIGDTDFSSYNTNNTQEYTFFQRLYPVVQAGNVVLIRVNLHRAGDIALYTVKPTGALQTFEYTAKVVVTGVVGYNEFVVNLPIEKDGLVGVGQLMGGGLLTTKTVTEGLWLDGNPDRSIGSPVTMSNSNRAAAIGFDFEINGLEDQISEIDIKADNIQSEVNTAIKVYDLTIEPATNMFDTTNIVNDRYVSNTGSIQNVAGWQFILINVSGVADGADITLNGIEPSMPYYAAFYTTDDPNIVDLTNMIAGSNVTFNGNPNTIQKPAGAVGLGITIKRPANTSAAYEFATINLGATPIPYEPGSSGNVVKILDYNIEGSGGEAYDQSLNTTDNVQFNSVTVVSFETDVLVAELPEGAGTPPLEVAIGQAWIDTTDDTIKVRRS